MGKRFLTALGICLAVSACGEREQRPGMVPQQQQGSGIGGGSCFPSVDSLSTPELATELAVDQAADCMERELLNGITNTRGQFADELSVSEIQTLKARGAISIPLTTDEQYQSLSGLLRFFHPQGRPAVTSAMVSSVAKWARTYARVYVRAIQWRRSPLGWSDIADISRAAEALLQLSGGNDQTRYSQAKELVRQSLQDASSRIPGSLLTQPEFSNEQETLLVFERLLTDRANSYYLR